MKILILTALVFTATFFGIGFLQKNRALYQQLAALEDNKDRPLDELSQECLRISREATDRDLKTYCYALGLSLSYYHGAGIDNGRDFENTGSVSRAARGILLMLTDPSKVYKGLRAGFQSLEFDRSQLQLSKQKLDKKYGGFNLSLWILTALTTSVATIIAFISRQFNSIGEQDAASDRP